mgnify:CR=1 FL=1
MRDAWTRCRADGGACEEADRTADQRAAKPAEHAIDNTIGRVARKRAIGGQQQSYSSNYYASAHGRLVHLLRIRESL